MNPNTANNPQARIRPNGIPTPQDISSPPSLGPASAPPPVTDYPPQMFITAASLQDLTDKKIMVTLRDGTHYFGILRSWDQYGNVLLSEAIERVFARIPPASPPPGADDDAAAGTRCIFADIPKGAFLARGENMTMIGEVDLDRDDDERLPKPWVRAEPSEVFDAAKKEKARSIERWNKARKGLRTQQGFEGESRDQVIL